MNAKRRGKRQAPASSFSLRFPKLQLRTALGCHIQDNAAVGYMVVIDIEGILYLYLQVIILFLKANPARGRG